MVTNKFHCYECAGTAKAKGEECSTCDGEGNPKEIASIKKESFIPKKVKKKKK